MPKSAKANPDFPQVSATLPRFQSNSDKKIPEKKYSNQHARVVNYICDEIGNYFPGIISRVEIC
ncbi:MAG: hypothetical protein DWQ05_12495 [Calditrichaeota bacterium]|nr:MAG: hypothetical protein DWQ05_12495 [Calditrichota bacterium]